MSIFSFSFKRSTIYSLFIISGVLLIAVWFFLSGSKIDCEKRFQGTVAMRCLLEKAAAQTDYSSKHNYDMDKKLSTLLRNPKHWIRQFRTPYRIKLAKIQLNKGSSLEAIKDFENLLMDNNLSAKQRTDLTSHLAIAYLRMAEQANCIGNNNADSCILPFSRAAHHTFKVSTDNLRRVLSITEKRFLNLSTDENAKRWRFHSQPAQLTAIYVLNNRNQTNTLSISPLSQTAGLLKLAGNVYPEYSLSQSDRARDFDVLGKLADVIPVHEVNIPDNIDALTQLRDAILTDFKTLI